MNLQDQTLEDLEQFAACLAAYLTARRQQALNLPTLREQLTTLEERLQSLTQTIGQKEAELAGLVTALQAEFEREARRFPSDHSAVQMILTALKQAQGPEQLIALGTTLRQQLRQAAADQDLNGSLDTFLTCLSQDHLDQTIPVDPYNALSSAIHLTKDDPEQDQPALWPKTKPEAADHLGPCLTNVKRDATR